MKTLLTEKQVYKIHKGDNVSARTVMKIGKIIRKRFTFFQCVDKIIFRIDTCPHCKSHNTFHNRAMKLDNCYDNVYKVYLTESDQSKVFQKIDYCLDCHKEFSIEMFCYEKLKFFKGLKLWLEQNNDNN